MFVKISLKSLLKASLIVFGAFAAVDASSAQALPLTLSLANPGFETPAAGTPSSKFPNGTPGLVWEGNAPSFGVEIFINNAFVSGQNVPAYQGNQFAEVQNNDILDSISQTVTGFIIGRPYSFSFAHRGRAGSDTLSFTVKNGGSSVFTSNYTAGNSAWILNTGTFVATAPSLELVFQGVSSAVLPGQPGSGNFIDAVSLVEVPGPLPLLGVASALAYSRRIRCRISKARS
ncbi:MAG: hypothetical protein QM522_12160 [Chitinophagaceae bacterium]|nr:hypothetical protein [Chitinophagaceae bacterium]